ncbi:MAG: 4-hydroxy-3-methylbut-2-enyl diphosphate reductase [Oscillospiraceae bacterium]|jgi:4-hydroxy-3-methylbut-2-enyl diphosphate reductase|nr:4-hydroxy-3-methylbut-2-enyl diphosphate reductase [Oscillospiraceae bacterium]
MSVIIRPASSAGFCFGVERAVSAAADAARRFGTVYALGELIHNKDVIDELALLGVVTIAEPAELPLGGVVIIRSHGEARGVYKSLLERTDEGNILDLTCPFVSRIHKIVRESARAGHQPVIIGDEKHAEVRGIAGQAESCLTYKNYGDFCANTQHLVDRPLDIVFQTTLSGEILKEFQNFAKKSFTSPKIYDTICNATKCRQEEAERLSKICDVMVVLGDSGSSNSRQLYEICREFCGRAVFGARLSQISGELSEIARTVSDHNNNVTIGLTAGASVSRRAITEVLNYMTEEFKATVQEEAETHEPAFSAEETAGDTQEAPETQDTADFAQLVDDSFVTARAGEKLTGTVIAVSKSEVTVDIGTKQSGIIPSDEVTSDPTKSPEDILAPGDAVECYVLRVNESIVTLSRRRLENEISWGEILEAKKERRCVSGVITEANKGGVVTSYNGQRVFIPASATGIARGGDLTPLLNKETNFYIMEVDRQKKQIIGSVTGISADERRARVKQLWAEIEVGKKYTGKVTSVTKFGAFVDIGGVDGLVHVSELSWDRISNPSQVVKEGDQLDVYVISYDPEKRRISLGHRAPDGDPWAKFSKQYKTGDEAIVKIVKLSAFGAFAELMPGVDGLIHISQIADHRVTTAGDVVAVGDEVKVKITAIDEDKRRISLSIRALFEIPAEDRAYEPRKRSKQADTIVYDTESNFAFNTDYDDEE